MNKNKINKSKEILKKLYDIDNTLENILIDILDNDLDIESKEVKYLTYSIGSLSKKISNMIE